MLQIGPLAAGFLPLVGPQVFKIPDLRLRELVAHCLDGNLQVV
jgi:hypothetical protein